MPTTDRRLATLCALCGLPIVVLAFVHGRAMYWLCDDAFISFRYVRNLVDGHGLVFNVGERVEGYTNFLWVLELAALWKFLGIEPPTGSVVLSSLCSVLLLAIVASMAWRSRTKERPLILIGSLLVLAFNRSFAVWCSSGLETRQFTLLIVAAVALLGRGRRLILASVLLGAAELTRPEGSLIFASCLAWLVLERMIRSRIHGAFAFRALARDVLSFSAPFVVIVAAHYLWRRGYYGEWLPNTYHAKHVRPWIESGEHYFTVAWLEHGMQVMIPLAILGALVRLAHGDATHVLSAMILVPHALYVQRIGGDHFEFRPLDFYWPLLSIAAVEGLFVLTSLARRVHGREDPLGWIAALIGFGAMVEYGTVLQRAHEALTSTLTTRGNAYKLFAEVTLENTPEIARLPGLRTRLEEYNTSSWFCTDHQSCTRRGEHRAYWQLLEHEFGPYRALDRIGHDAIPRGGVWAREAVGIAPYYLPEIEVIDLFGLTDRVIARSPVEKPNTERVMAHDRHPPPGYLEQRGVNISVGAAARSQGEVLKNSYWALRLRDDLWMPFLSPDGDWVVHTFAGRPLFSQFHLDPTNVHDNHGWVSSRFSRGTDFLGRFDDDLLDGWTQLDGDPLDLPDHALATDSFGAYGHGWLTTRGRTSGDAATSRVVSPVFTARGTLVFLLGGCGDPGRSGISLQIDGATVKTWDANGASFLGLFTFDLAPYAGRPATLEVLDRSTSAHVDLDQVMLVDAE